jgi:hypothetical protein
VPEVRGLFDQLANPGRLLSNLPAPPNVLRAIIGFVILLGLAYLAGHPRVKEVERRLNIAHFGAAGLPFVLLGFLASRPFMGVLPPEALREIGPLMTLGLGWIGFVIGSRFRGVALDRVGPGTGPAVFLTTGLSFAVIFVVSALLFLGVTPLLEPSSGAEALRNALLLATAGTMAARSAPHFLKPFLKTEEVSLRLVRIIELEQLAGVFGIMMISTFFRPAAGEVSWQLPGAAWLFVVFGIGTLMGLVIVLILNNLHQSAQFTAALLGAVAFTAGMASYLRLSSIAVCCIAGAVLMNLGGAWRDQVQAILERMERPIYFAFLVIVGALWRPWEWQGWVLMALFVAGRFGAKWLAAEILERHFLKTLTPAERWTLVAAPMSALSVAIVVSAQTLYSTPAVGWIVTAVIGGTIVMEAALQVAARKRPSGDSAAPAASPVNVEGP